MKTHTTMGANILKNSKVPFIQMGARIAACHHEKWDGTGYPAGTSGEQIPIEAGVTCLVDVYDALINKRVYKSAWLEADVLVYLREQSGKFFNPELVDLFFDHLDHFRAIQNQHPDTYATPELP